MPPTPATTAPIGIFDSGIGGLSVAAAIAEYLPGESLLYVADNAYAPYGPRPAAEIWERSQLITKFLLGRGAKMIVVACNTATSLAIDALREAFPGVPFVGLEPAVKPAAEARRVGVMATTATLHSPRYQALRRKYLADRPVHENACVGLVPLIETEEPGSPLLIEKLQSILAPMLADNIDALVLGCTHFPMIRADIEAVCGPGVRVIDPSPAAARQVARLLAERTLLLPAPFASCGPAHLFFTTASSVPLQRSLLALPLLNRHRKLLVPRAELTA
jgi:glutamate racemase